MLDIMKINSVRVHNGVFHADDVCVVALIEFLRSTWFPLNDQPALGQVRVIRARVNDAGDEADLVADVGNGPYDHHDRNFNKYYANGIKYAAVGLVLEDLNIDPDLKQTFLDLGLYAVQAQDNGQQGVLKFIRDGEQCETDLNKLSNPFSFIARMNATWKEGGIESYAQTTLFDQAVDMAETVFARLAATHLAAKAAKEKITPILESLDKDAQIIVLPEFVNSWQRFVIEANEERATKIIGCVFPGQGDNWNVQVVPKENGAFAAWSKHPDNWCGLSGAELSEASGLAGGIFCHKAGFLSVWKTKGGAIEAALRLEQI